MASSGCKPNRIFFVAPHSIYSSKINVYDITSQIQINSDLEDHVKVAEQRLKSNPASSCMTVDCNMWSSRRQVYLEPGRQFLAEWKTKSLSGRSDLNFSSGATGNHEVQMRPANIMSRCEEFVFNGAEYSWEQDSKWHEHRSTMYMKTHGQNHIVGISAQKRKRDLSMMYKLEGLFALNDKQIDWQVALLSYIVVIYKRLYNRALLSAST